MQIIIRYLMIILSAVFISAQGAASSNTNGAFDNKGNIVINKLHICEHALERMHERNIQHYQIRQTLTSGIVIAMGDKRYRFIECDSKLPLNVIVDLKNSGNHVVITCYRTDKLCKEIDREDTESLPPKKQNKNDQQKQVKKQGKKKQNKKDNMIKKG